MPQFFSTFNYSEDREKIFMGINSFHCCSDDKLQALEFGACSNLKKVKLADDSNQDETSFCQTPPDARAITGLDSDPFMNKQALFLKNYPRQAQEESRQTENKRVKGHEIVKNTNESHSNSFNDCLKSIGWNDFIILGRVGKGAMGQVFLVELKNAKLVGEREKFALKRMKKTDIKKNSLLDHIRTEQCISRQAQSNFITKSKCFFRDQKYYYLAMEWAEGGDIYSCFKAHSKRQPLFKRAGQDAVRFILGCLILSLEYLHAQGIIYADLKPENAIIFADGYVKLTDFGLSHKVQKGQNFKVSLGTSLYFAPEIVSRQQCGTHIDLWALGVLAYELVTFSLPFKYEVTMNEELFTKAVKKIEEKGALNSDKVSLNLKSLISGLLRFDPNERLGANGWSEIKNHDFFKEGDFDWKKLEDKKILSPLLPVLKEKIPVKAEYTQKVDPSQQRVSNIDRESSQFWDQELTLIA